MATDCDILSENARKIFDKIKPYFPPDPWKKPQWTDEGTVFSNGWHDLKKNNDRKKLIEWQKYLLGSLVETSASMYHKQHDSLDGFTSEHFTRHMQEVAGLLLLLNDLDFQIETMDLVDG